MKMLFAVLAASRAFALSADDQAWMMKVDYRHIKQATDRCKEIRRSCLAFGEEPIPAQEWVRILDGLSPEEKELMRRRYSIPSEAMAAANGAVIRRARGRGEELRDAVGSFAPAARQETRRRIASITAGVLPRRPETDAVAAVAAPAPRPAPRPALIKEDGGPMPDLQRPRRAAPPPPPGEARPIPLARLVRLRQPLERAADSGKLDVRTISQTLRWAKENPPLDDKEKSLRERAEKVLRRMGNALGPEEAAELKSLARESGLALTPAQEENIVKAVEEGLSFWDKFKLMRYR